MNLFQKILFEHWGYSQFRPLQEEIITSVYNGNDTLALMPTGGGKSITFQVPALARDGICIVITPLIALMKDQVENLKKHNIPALAVHSGMNAREIEITLDNAKYGNYKFLYISPERLATQKIHGDVGRMKINLIAVDESHCISQWGYDFRPSYLQIAEIRNILPDVPVLALTATATPEVVDDIMEKLRFRKKNVLQKSFERKNLSYIVRDMEDKQKYLKKIIETAHGSGIVYVRNRKKTKEISVFLNSTGIKADYYHAGLSPEIRSHKQDLWKSGKIQVIVATNAFGMGIDKPDVRFVVHLDLPDSPEAYFQEAGRAGRDEKRAYAVLLYNNSDKVKFEQQFKMAFPPVETVKEIYQSVCSYLGVAYGDGKGTAFNFNLMDFSIHAKIYSLTALNALKILEYENYLQITDEINSPSRLMFNVNRDDLYKIQVENKDLDSFIKILLRAYTGLFSNFTNIDETYLAKFGNTTVDVINEYLIQLSRKHLISYIPQRRTPLLILNESRLEEANVRISPENYILRKERYKNRMDAMIGYAMSKAKCRSQILLSYFGEENVYRCGKCDVCKTRNELDISAYEFDRIVEELKKQIANTEAGLQEIIDNISISSEKVIKVVRWLLDNGKISENENRKLIWKKSLLNEQ
ncbi:MAG: RecQ family ATP-dependent DNA helicase [Prevotellaceae bacterium]|nr:RecQ family ATP-dependent DNA helicase [Prevotellaceae bacterium]